MNEYEYDLTDMQDFVASSLNRQPGKPVERKQIAFQDTINVCIDIS